MIGPLPVAAEARQGELLGPVDDVVHRLELEHFVVLQNHFFFKYVSKNVFSILLLNVVNSRLIIGRNYAKNDI